MANQEHLDILKQGVETWNQWRKEHADIQPDLSGANLSGADLRGKDLVDANLSKANLSGANLSRVELYGADLSEANLSGADLRGKDLVDANLSKANLSGANLRGADLRSANLRGVHLRGADLREAALDEADLRGGVDLSTVELWKASFSRADLRGVHLRGADLREVDFGGAELREANLPGANLSGVELYGADLSEADLSGADLSGADLSGAILVRTNLSKATLTKCRVYGISVWDVDLTETDQSNLIISDPLSNEPTITVDNLKIAQFIYLLLNNAEIRDVIDTIARKAVLILGRFTPERKAVLNALREALRTHGYVPILFDFDKPTSRDLTETISTLAHLSRFIIADLTEPSSIPKELEAIVPTLAVPVQPLLEGSTRPYAMFKDYWKYQWVLEVYRYNGLEELLASLKEHVIEPAERKAKEFVQLRAQAFEKR